MTLPARHPSGMWIVTETLRDYLRDGYRIGLDCPRCGREPDADLAKLCDEGYGDTPIQNYRPRCRKCHERLSKVVLAPEKRELLKDGRPIAYR